MSFYLSVYLLLPPCATFSLCSSAFPPSLCCFSLRISISPSLWLSVCQHLFFSLCHFLPSHSFSLSFSQRNILSSIPLICLYSCVPPTQEGHETCVIFSLLDVLLGPELYPCVKTASTTDFFSISFLSSHLPLDHFIIFYNVLIFSTKLSLCIFNYLIAMPCQNQLSDLDIQRVPHVIRWMDYVQVGHLALNFLFLFCKDEQYMLLI